MDSAARTVLLAMQQRGLAAMSLPQIEKQAAIGSSEVVLAALHALMEQGLVVSHRIGREIPIQYTLTAAGRSHRESG